ncbi:hypothetical protein GSH19_03785 [Lactobacillus sp. S2-2]|uniref:hypothetical protein n=1 Tax=Lactobacillus sp. S2-2 TaxID=2692917 RepID=UPI001F2DEA25|nr:hypothetical protein [Lactobacillus sp. S2-2]MCF6515274.1 hypothetical protein [Lactobacillus sp. S2-2]
MDEKEFINQITEANFEHTELEMTMKKFTDRIAANLMPLNNFIADNIKKNKVARAEIRIKDEEFIIRLEICAINLPLEYVNSIAKIIVKDGELPMQVNMIIDSPNVSKSNLRIDKLADAEEFIENFDSDGLTTFVEWTKNELEVIETNKNKAEEAE